MHKGAIFRQHGHFNLMYLVAEQNLYLMTTLFQGRDCRILNENKNGDSYFGIISQT